MIQSVEMFYIIHLTQTIPERYAILVISVPYVRPMIMTSSRIYQRSTTVSTVSL